MKKKYIEAVESGNLVRVRLFLTNELMLDPRGNSFLEMKLFAESHLPNLYDRDDSKCYSMNECDWNEELLFSLKNDLDDNFSKEKLAIYEKIAKYVLKDKAEQLAKEEAMRSDVIGKAKSTQTQKRTKKQIYTGITVGCAGVAVIGLCLSRVALASLGLAGTVVGGILLYNESKK